jgi:hypothetical protein
MNAPKLTPLMVEYNRLKSLAPDGLLMIRLGDFYEFFFEDAKVAAKILNIALTKRNDVPMAGIPYHALDKYSKRLVEAGHKVCIAEKVGGDWQKPECKIVERYEPEKSPEFTDVGRVIASDRYLNGVRIGIVQGATGLGDKIFQIVFLHENGIATVEGVKPFKMFAAARLFVIDNYNKK